MQLSAENFINKALALTLFLTFRLYQPSCSTHYSWWLNTREIPEYDKLFNESEFSIKCQNIPHRLIMNLGRFKEMKECPNTYYITVIENTDTRKIVAAASLVLEQKFIHEIAMVKNLNL